MSPDDKSPFGAPPDGDAPAFEPFPDEFSEAFDEELPPFDLGDMSDVGKGSLDPEMLKLRAQMLGAEYYIKLATMAQEAQLQAEKLVERGRSTMREAPLETVGGAFAAGALIAFVLRRR